jgi:hypothetical protein
MKKAIVLLLALAILGGAVFAEDAAYTLSGSASLKWGYDLNTEAHGFTNSASATLIIPFVAEQSSTHGEEAITGSIMIEDFAYVISNDSDEALFAAGDVTAKILFPNSLYLKIASKPSFKVNYAEMFELLTADDDWEDAELNAPEITSAGGFTFGMDGDFSFALKVGSTNKHTLTAATDDVWGWVDDDDDPTTVPIWAIVTPAAAAEVAVNKYIVGVDAGYKLGDLAAFNAKFVYGPMGATTPVIGLGLKAAVTPIESLDLVLAADMELTDDAYGLIDLMFTADYEMADLFSFGTGFYAILDTEATSGNNPMAVAKVRAGLLAVENLTFDLGLDLLDVLNTLDVADMPMGMIISADVAYKAMLGEENYVKPYLNVAMMPEGKLGATVIYDKVTTLNVGVETKLIPMTTFKLDFTAGEFDANMATGTSMGSDAGQDKGVITFTTKITY